MAFRPLVPGLALAIAAAATSGCARPLDPSVAYATPVAPRPQAPPARSEAGYPVGQPTAVSPRAVVGAVPASGWRLDAEMRVGNPRGHVQIPKGGQPGTTSPGRPSFDEVGVESAWGPFVDLSYRRGPHLLHVGGGMWVLHGSEALRDPLTSHEKSYVAGTDIESSTEIGEAWLGYGYTFCLSRCVTFTPGVGVYASRLDYEISGGGQTSRREFTSLSPMLEAELAWRPGGRMHFSADMRLVADEWWGLDSPTQVYELGLRTNFDLSACGRLWLSVGATSISHHDEQPVPNDYLLEVLPWFGLGGELRF
jgi:hypothetical protein